MKMWKQTKQNQPARAGTAKPVRSSGVTCPSGAARPSGTARSSGAFRSRREKRRYQILLAVLIGLGVLAALGLAAYDIPVPVTSSSFIPIVKRRMTAIVAMLIAAVCQSLATVAFQTCTGNRIITPSLLGFDSLYSAIQTGTMFFFGTTAFLEFTGTGPFLLQVAAMILLCLILYGWLLSGRYGNIQLMLLVGIMIGSGLKSLASFMRRLLAPSEYDILQARLFGSVANADAAYFPIAIPLVALAAVLLLVYSRKLNVLALGRDASTALGLNHQRGTIYVLVLVAVLMSVSTALIGSLTFYGFLVAALAYQAVPSGDHRYIFPMALAIGFLVLTFAYFFMYNVFRAQGVVAIIIELFGGIAFLIVLLRKGSL